MLETCTNDIEEVIKYVLIQSPFKIKKKISYDDYYSK